METSLDVHQQINGHGKQNIFTQQNFNQLLQKMKLGNLQVNEMKFETISVCVCVGGNPRLRKTISFALFVDANFESSDVYILSGIPIDVIK